MISVGYRKLWEGWLTKSKKRISDWGKVDLFSHHTSITLYSITPQWVWIYKLVLPSLPLWNWSSPIKRNLTFKKRPTILWSCPWSICIFMLFLEPVWENWVHKVDLENKTKLNPLPSCPTCFLSSYSLVSLPTLDSPILFNSGVNTSKETGLKKKPPSPKQCTLNTEY